MGQRRHQQDINASISVLVGEVLLLALLRPHLLKYNYLSQINEMNERTIQVQIINQSFSS